MEDSLDHAFGQLIVRVWYHFLCLTEESIQIGLFFDGCIVLTRLQHDDEVGEVIGLWTACERRLMIFLIVHIAELLQNIEDNLRVDACHAEGLQEPSQTLLDVAVKIILSVKIFHQ